MPRKGNARYVSAPWDTFLSGFADQELKSCHFQQDWDSRLFISRHAVLGNKWFRGGNLLAALCPVSGQVSFSWVCGQAQRERHDRKKGRGDCVTWESVLGTSHFSFSVVPVSPHFFVVKPFCRYFWVAQSCCDRRRAASCQQSTSSAGQGWQEAAAPKMCLNLSRKYGETRV